MEAFSRILCSCFQYLTTEIFPGYLQSREKTGKTYNEKDIFFYKWYIIGSKKVHKELFQVFNAETDADITKRRISQYIKFSYTVYHLFCCCSKQGSTYYLLPSHGDVYVTLKQQCTLHYPVVWVKGGCTGN